MLLLKEYRIYVAVYRINDSAAYGFQVQCLGTPKFQIDRFSDAKSSNGLSLGNQLITYVAKPGKR